ncbi:MAG TPA: methyltransferase domain-containing protein, partial [Bacteroidota bacterium]|nr:methyltransferase domain-containing protein [Bacteroidota bacterium]
MNDRNHEKQLAVFGNFSGFLEETRCPTCQAPPAPKLIFRKSEGIGIWECPGCGVYYASPRFDEPSLLGIYENEAFSDMSFYDTWTYETWQQSDARGWFVSNLKTQLVKRYVPGGSAILDIGCSTGEFVAVARRNDLDAEGIDNSKMLTDVGRNILKVPVHQADVKDFRPSRKYRGIVIWDVLEHLYDPVDMLEQCAKLMEPGGFLFAQVPNLRGISNRLKSFACRTGMSKNNYGHFGFPYHLFFFDRRSLGALVRSAGFEAVHFESWSHLLKDNKHGLLADIIIAATKKYCLTDYIIV